MTLALTRSPRSTWGTTRTTAYSNALGTGTLRLLDERRERLPAVLEPLAYAARWAASSAKPSRSSAIRN